MQSVKPSTPVVISNGPQKSNEIPDSSYNAEASPKIRLAACSMSSMTEKMIAPPNSNSPKSSRHKPAKVVQSFSEFKSSQEGISTRPTTANPSSSRSPQKKADSPNKSLGSINSLKTAGEHKVSSPKDIQKSKASAPIKMKLNIAEKLESHLVSSIKKDANGIPEPAGNSKVKTRNLEKHIRKRWFFLYRTQQFAVRLSKAYRSITTSNYSRLTQLPILDAGTLTYMLKTQIVEPSEAYIHQIEASLKEPAFKRSPETVSNLEKVLSLRMPDFARYSSNERNFFCQAMQLEKYPKGTILMKENNPATNFYFLLSGQVEVFKFDNGYKLRVQTTNIGKLDKSGKEYRRTRAAVKDSKKECMCSNNCLFQTINDHKRRLPGSSNLLTKFINNGERALVKQKLESALSSVRIFSNHISILEKISGLFQIYNYPKGEVIHHEGGQTFELSWVIDGKCQIVRSVSFHCKNLNGKQIFSIPSGEKETITELELITQTLKPGDWFPDIPLLPDQPTNLKYLGPEKLHKDSYVQLYTKMPPNDKITYYKYSIKADSPVTIATIPLNDFCEIVPKDLLFKFIFTESNTLYPIKELQIQYLQQQSWNMHKQNIVSEILHK